MASQWLLEKRGLSRVVGTSTQTTPRAPVQDIQPIQKSEPRKYLGGNFIDKAFDVLRTPEYAGTGFIQGGMEQAKKTGAINSAPITRPMDYARSIIAGVKNVPKAISERREFGREEGQYNVAEEAGIKNKYAQTGVNLVGSIAMPSLALGAVAKGVSKFPGVSKVVGRAGGAIQKGVEFARQTPKIAKVVEKFDPFFRNPVLGKLVREAEERVATRQNEVINVVTKAAKKLKPEEQRIIGQILEGNIANDPTGKYQKLAQPIRELSDTIGKEAVDLGLLSKESFEMYKGKYMTHIWEKMKKGGDKINFGTGVIPKATSKTWNMRKGAEGYISEFSPAALKGLGSEVRDIEVSKMYKQIADTFGSEAGSYLESGKAFAPSSIVSSKAGKVLRNKELPQEVVDAMTATMTPQKRNIFDKAYDLWKKGKTIYNPAYHVRNLMSNQILSDMSTGQGLGRTILNYGKSVAEYKGKGSQEFVEAANKANLIGRKNLGGAFQEAMDVAGYGKPQGLLQKVARPFQKVDKAVTGFQNASEETAKLNVFTTWIKKAAKDAGKSVQEALQDEGIINMAKKKAEEAIFSPYNISKTERGIASKVVPFYSFTRQATPFVAKTALNKPGTLTKYEKGKSAIEGLSAERKGEYKPESAKGQIRLPMTDKEKRSYYADLQYVLPWGNMGSEMGGNLSKGRLPLGLSLAPQFTIPAELAMNKQLYYDTPITKSKAPSQKTEDYKNYLLRSIGPSVLSAGQKLKSAIAGEPDWAGRNRNVPSAVGNFMGLKTASFVPEEQKGFDMRDINTNLKDINYEINKWRRSKDPNSQRNIQELLDLKKAILAKKQSI